MQKPLFRAEERDHLDEGPSLASHLFRFTFPLAIGRPCLWCSTFCYVGTNPIGRRLNCAASLLTQTPNNPDIFFKKVRGAS